MRLLITGANQPKTKALLRALHANTSHTLYVTDSAPYTKTSSRITLLHTLSNRRSQNFAREILNLCTRHSIQAILPTRIDDLEALTCISPEFSVQEIHLLCPSLQTVTTCNDLWSFVQATSPWAKLLPTKVYLERPHALYTPKLLIHRYKHDLQRLCFTLQDLQRISPNPQWLLQDHIEAPSYKVHAFTTPDCVTYITHDTQHHGTPPPKPAHVAQMSRLTRTLALHLRLQYNTTITFQCTPDDIIYLTRIEPIVTHRAAHTPEMIAHLQEMLAHLGSPPQPKPSSTSSASYKAPRLDASVSQSQLHPLNIRSAPRQRRKTPPPYQKNPFHIKSHLGDKK